MRIYEKTTVRAGRGGRANRRTIKGILQWPNAENFRFVGSPMVRIKNTRKIFSLTRKRIFY